MRQNMEKIAKMCERKGKEKKEWKPRERKGI